MKLELDITPPDGYEAVRIGIPEQGELFVDLSMISINGKVNGLVMEAGNQGQGVCTFKLILRKKQQKEIIIFESTGELREPRAGEYFRMSNEYLLAIGYKHFNGINFGNKKIFKCIKHTYED